MRGPKSLDSAPFPSEDVRMQSAEKRASGGGSSGRGVAMPAVPERELTPVVAERLGAGVCVVDKQLRRIRARSSYRLFRELHEFLESKPDVAAILQKLYDILDARSAFGSRQNAAFAAESLGQVLKDMEDRTEKRQDTEVV